MKEKLVWLVGLSIFLSNFLGTLNAYGAIAFVRSASTTLDGGSNVNATTTITASAGDTLVEMCATYQGTNGSGGITSVTSDGGLTWNYAASSSLDGSPTKYVVMYYASNVAAATYNVDCTGSSVPGRQQYVNEYSGISNTNPVDATSSALGTGTKITDPGNLTTTGSADVVVAMGFFNGQTGVATVNPNYTNRGEYDGTNNFVAAVDFDWITTATQTTDATSSWANNGSWNAIAGAFFQATAASSSQNRQRVVSFFDE